MNRCKASLGILIGLILLCIFSLVTLRIEEKNYLAMIEKLEESLETGTTEQALLAFDELKNYSENYDNIIGIFVDGSELNEIKLIISGLQPMIINNHEDISVEIAKLKILVQNIYQEDFPKIWH
ncbi:MAG: DUF4363 family protein, partial [Oscillospiraceae bacterium]|nr:DUF4363 family protein [Oscillospiraceae bacterium]